MNTRQMWEHQAAQVLRKARRLSPDSPDDQVWSALSATTIEGLAVPSLGLPSTSDPRGDDGRRRAEAGWASRPQIVLADPDAAAAAAFDEWQHDSTSVWLTVGGPGTEPAVLGRALDRIPLDILAVVVSAAGSTTDIEAAQAFSDVLRLRGLVPAVGSSLGADPIGRLLRTRASGPGSTVAAAIRDIAAVAKDLNVGALVADGTAAHLRGAGDAAEVGFVLATAVHYLRELERLGYPLVDGLGLIGLRLAATDDQFTTIAKFRATRALWTRIADLSRATPRWRSEIHAVTSTAMMTRYDPWTNLLRTTVAAFAAGVGGADVLTVQPFDAALGVPAAQGRRLARNISALLLEEAHVADVADPAGGSWAVETLTDSMADAAWSEFLRIEAGGGIVACLLDGSLQSRYADTRARRAARINTRSQAITGISEFPELGEQLLPRRPYPAEPAGTAERDGSSTASWAADFEALRDDPPAEHVFLATLGPLATHGARAGFVTNALAVGGVGVTSAGPTATVEDVRTAFTAQSSVVVCLAGPDAGYAESAESVVAALREAGARWFILAGRPTAAQASLFDDHVGIGDDLLAFLHRTRQALARTSAARRGAIL